MTSPEISIRPARLAADRREVLRVAYDAFEAKQSRAYYDAIRLSSPLRNLAEWWLLEEKGRAVSSLLCYDLTFAIGEDPSVGGYGFGSVATHRREQKKGFASRLMQHIIAEKESKGQQIGLLFSLIPPAYYERLGFVVCPAMDFFCTDLKGLAESGENAVLTPIDPLQELDDLSLFYEQGHPGLRLARNESAWRTNLRISDEDVFFSIGSRDGYARLIVDDKTVEVLELFTPTDLLAQHALRAIAALAADLKRESLNGWLRPSHVPEGWFTDRGRTRTLPMIRGNVDPKNAWFWGTDHF